MYQFFHIRKLIDLTGVSVGDRITYCSCGYQYPEVNICCVNECPVCLRGLRYVVADQEFLDGGAHDSHIHAYIMWLLSFKVCIPFCEGFLITEEALNVQ